MPYYPRPIDTFYAGNYSPRSWLAQEYGTTGVGPYYVPYSALPLSDYPGLMLGAADLPWITRIPGFMYTPPAPGTRGQLPWCSECSPNWPGPLYPGDRGLGWHPPHLSNRPQFSPRYPRSQMTPMPKTTSASNPTIRPRAGYPTMLAYWRAKQRFRR